MDKEFDQDEILEAAFAPARPLIDRASATYSDRRGVYGPSEQKFADVMLALFPHGLRIDRRQDWVRYGIFIQVVSKLVRYANNPYSGHIDSIHDMGVYAFMLEAEDRRDQGVPPFRKSPNLEDTK